MTEMVPDRSKLKKKGWLISLVEYGTSQHIKLRTGIFIEPVKAGLVTKHREQDEHATAAVAER